MIPKIIHYCWFGENPKTKLIKKCIKSWIKFCPDYKIIEWNESNIDLAKYVYASQAYKMKKFAFVSDQIRFIVLQEHGGIYLDTDVEIVKNIDDLLSNNCFMGFETNTMVAPGLIVGSEKDGILVKKIVDFYERQRFILNDGSLNLSTVVQYTTGILSEMGLKVDGSFQKSDAITLYPIEWFNPYDIRHSKSQFTKNTYSIHHFQATWMTKEQKRVIRRTKLIQKIFGKKIYKFLSKTKNYIKERIK